MAQSSELRAQGKKGRRDEGMKGRRDMAQSAELRAQGKKGRRDGETEENPFILSLVEATCL